MTEHNANHIIPSYCHLPVSWGSLVDRCGSLGSCKPQIYLFFLNLTTGPESKNCMAIINSHSAVFIVCSHISILFWLTKTCVRVKASIKFCCALVVYLNHSSGKLLILSPLLFLFLSYSQLCCYVVPFMIVFRVCTRIIVTSLLYVGSYSSWHDLYALCYT